MEKMGGKFKVGVARVAVALGLLFFNPGWLGAAEVWQDIVNDTLLTFGNVKDIPSTSLGVDTSGNVHVVWDGGWRHGSSIYYTKLDINGNKLVPNTRLTPVSDICFDARLGVDTSNNVHIAWYDMNAIKSGIHYTKLYSNGSRALEATGVASFSSETFYHETLGFTVDTSGYVHITWDDVQSNTMDRVLYYIKLNNTGNKVIEKQLVSTNNAWGRASLGVDTSNNVHIAWKDRRDNNLEIYYTKLDINGNKLVSDTRLTSTSAISESPSLGVDTSNNVHIAWTERHDNNHEIYYTKLDINGNKLVPNTRLTPVSATSYYPSLGVDSAGNIHIAWSDRRDGYRDEIYYTKLDNNGNRVVNDTRLTYDSASSKYPSLGVDSAGNVHIAYSSSNIYYTKGRTVTIKSN